MACPKPESVRVVIQTRPLLPFEKADGAISTLTQTSQPALVTLHRPQTADVSFPIFDAVYSAQQGAKPDNVYTDHVAPLVTSLLSGINATVFAYGQTSAGKTYTMQHVTKRVASQLFEEKSQAADQGVTVSVRISFVEIYREKIRDLVNGGDGNDVPDIYVRQRADKDASVFLDGVRECSVDDEEGLMAIIREGAQARQTAATDMNANSSRSHSIITISIQQEPDNGNGPCLTSKLHLVDLAGSERAKRAGADGERFAEGVEINKSLFSLAKVISALAENADGAKLHVPYRDSKLTRLLQDSLGGNARTLLLACISPANNSREETLSTLRYAERAKLIKNRPTVNTEQSVAECDLRDALARAKAEIAALAADNERLRRRLEIDQVKMSEGRGFGLLSLKKIDDSSVSALEEDVEWPFSGWWPLGATWFGECAVCLISDALKGLRALYGARCPPPISHKIVM